MNLKNKTLMIGNVLLAIGMIVMLITNYKNYDKANIYKDKFVKSEKIKNQYKDRIDELNSTLATKSNVNGKTANIEKISTEFATEYFNYSALTKNRIYDNIKPYSTKNLIDKLKPIKENDLESDENYRVSIENIKVYMQYESLNFSNMTVLVLADERIRLKGSDTTSPILLQLTLKAVNTKLLVDNLVVNQDYRNTNYSD